MTLPQFRDALVSVIPETYHLRAADKAPFPHLVWLRTWGDFLPGDNTHRRRKAQIQLNLYTRDEYDPLIDQLEAALDKMPDVAYGEPIPDYDAETDAIRWIWECEVLLT